MLDAFIPLTAKRLGRRQSDMLCRIHRRAEMPLDELREARAMTQVHLAKVLRVNQAAVSKMERRTDMYVSTLKEFVRAMGGELKITAEFADGVVEISQFETVKRA